MTDRKRAGKSAILWPEQFINTKRWKANTLFLCFSKFYVQSSRALAYPQSLKKSYIRNWVSKDNQVHGGDRLLCFKRLTGRFCWFVPGSPI